MAFALLINVRQFIHVRKVKYVLVADVSIVVKTLCAVLALPVNRQRANVFANRISLEIQTIFACHVSFFEN